MSPVENIKEINVCGIFKLQIITFITLALLIRLPLQLTELGDRPIARWMVRTTTFTNKDLALVIQFVSYVRNI